MIGLALAVALVLTKGCHETSDSQAVGFAHCRRFGAWDAAEGPRFDVALTAGAGWMTTVPDAGPTELSLGSGKTATTINAFQPGALGGARVALATVDLRLDVFRWGPLRCGVAYRQGLAPTWSAATPSPVGMLQLHAPTTTLFSLPAGVDLRWRRVALTADIAPALSSFSAGITDDLSLDRPMHFTLVVGAGVRVWLTPALALEAGSSVDVLAPANISAGLKLHLPLFGAFDGVDPVLG